jgi:preprotein translocase subunit SecA
LKSATLTDHGFEEAEKMLGIGNIYTDKGIKYVHHLETAVRAKALYSRDKEYVVKDNEVVIVDEFTGRLQPGRRWSDGLHQAIEAKENVTIQQESRTYASITFQN